MLKLGTCYYFLSSYLLPFRTMLNCISNEMKFDIHMFSSIMELLIFCEMNCTLVVIVHVHFVLFILFCFV